MSNANQNMLGNIGTGAPMMMNPVSSMPSVSVVGGGGAGPSTNTFLLNPSTAAQQHMPTINTQQINHMVASSPLATQQHVAQFSGQQQQQQPPIMGQIGAFGQHPPQQQQQQQPAQLYTPSSSMQQQQQQQPSTSSTLGPNAIQVDVNNFKQNKLILTSEESQKPHPKSHPVVVLDRQRLQELVKEVDPDEQLEEEVEDILLNVADDFIDSLVSSACMISKHRQSGALEVRDVQLALEKNWNMWVPGFGIDGLVGVFTGAALGPNASACRLPKKCITTEAHKQRMALIRKSLKKI